MSDALLTVRIHILSPTAGRAPAVELALDPATTLRDLLTRLVREHALPAGAGWTFRARDGSVLPLDEMLREVAARSAAGGVLELILLPPTASIPPSGAVPPSRAARPAAPAAEAAADFESGTVRDEPAPRLDRVQTAPAFAPPPMAKQRARASGELMTASPTERRATVRYYSRMNPDRMFPLLVVLSAQQIQEIVKAKVKQAVSETFRVAEGTTVEIEPVLPGCDVYPPRHSLAVGVDDVATETFWVVPRVIGRVHGARVLVRQGDRVLAAVPLEVKVSRQTLAVACGLMSLAAPYLTMGLKSLKLDYDSQKADGFPLYQQAGTWVAENVRPEWLGLGFLGLALLLYLWMRPRRRNVFWDVSLKS